MCNPGSGAAAWMSKVMILIFKALQVILKSSFNKVCNKKKGLIREIRADYIMQIFMVLTTAPFGPVSFSPPRQDTQRTHCTCPHTPTATLGFAPVHGTTRYGSSGIKSGGQCWDFTAVCADRAALCHQKGKAAFIPLCLCLLKHFVSQFNSLK